MVAWTGIARHEHSREGLRYPSDMTDAGWALIMPFVPPGEAGRTASHGGYARGCKRDTPYRLGWVCVASAAEMLSTGLDRQALLLRMA